jgi:hypothetical protein
MEGYPPRSSRPCSTSCMIAVAVKSLDGTNSEEGLLRDNGPLVFKVGEAISLGEKDLALFHQHENRAWDVQRLHLFGKESNQG